MDSANSIEEIREGHNVNSIYIKPVSILWHSDWFKDLREAPSALGKAVISIRYRESSAMGPEQSIDGRSGSVEYEVFRCDLIAVIFYIEIRDDLITKAQFTQAEPSASIYYRKHMTSLEGAQGTLVSSRPDIMPPKELIVAHERGHMQAYIDGIPRFRDALNAVVGVTSENDKAAIESAIESALAPVWAVIEPRSNAAADQATINWFDNAGGTHQVKPDEFEGRFYDSRWTP